MKKKYLLLNTIYILKRTTLFLLRVLKCLQDSQLIHTDIKLENIFFKWDRSTCELSLILGDIEGLCKYDTSTVWLPGQGTKDYKRPILQKYPEFADDAYAACQTLLYIIHLEKPLAIMQAKENLLTYHDNVTFIDILCDYILPMLKKVKILYRVCN